MLKHYDLSRDIEMIFCDICGEEHHPLMKATLESLKADAEYRERYATYVIEMIKTWNEYLESACESENDQNPMSKSTQKRVKSLSEND